MSLNNIVLTEQQVLGLYPDVLIEEKSSAPGRQITVPFLGNNTKGILLIVENPEVPYLPHDELSFLTTILSACKLSLADVAIINTHSLSEKEIHETIQTLQPKTVLLFGMMPPSIGLPINFPQFQLQSFNKRTYLYSPALNEVERDKTLKLKLWNSLKTMFGLL